MPLATVRVACLAAVSIAPWRRLVPQRNSSMRERGASASGAGLAPVPARPFAGPGAEAVAGVSAANASARAFSISSADSRSTGVS